MQYLTLHILITKDTTRRKGFGFYWKELAVSTLWDIRQFADSQLCFTGIKVHSDEAKVGAKRLGQTDHEF
jgi:hypothetical protein